MFDGRNDATHNFEIITCLVESAVLLLFRVVFTDSYLASDFSVLPGSQLAYGQKYPGYHRSLEVD